MDCQVSTMRRSKISNGSGRTNTTSTVTKGNGTDEVPYIKTEPAIILEELTHMDESAFVFCENDGNQSDDLTDGDQVITVSQEDDDCLGTICQVCNKTYKNKRSLSTHLRVKHNLSAQSRAKMPCLESGCEFRGNRIARLISHLIRTHKMKFQCEKVTFQQKEDFWKWKKEAEERCRASYSAQTSAKTMVSGDVKFFLRCRRSGFIKSTDAKSLMPRSRFMKKGSMKINAVCTSFMEVMFMKEGGATVHFCRTHYGHDEDGSHLRMNNEERDMIKDLILEGFSASKIIAIMKTRMPVHRHQLLKYANIRNISVRQNLFMTRGKGLVGSSRRVFLRKIPKCLLVRPGEDSSMSLQVENEIEVEAEMAEADSSYPTLIVQTYSQGNVFRENIEKLKELRNEIQTKIERISRLASGLVSDTALRRLSESLDNVAKNIENEKHIEVIPESPDTTSVKQQNIVLHKDTDGNSVLLLCSNKNIEDLVDSKNVNIDWKQNLNVTIKKEVQ
ncbi:uncharacterized protein LOC121864972 [Homarus americanus]|uniref:C2H2-type domain-containing protein n=1 Tax=Homarus americanus TaxID=6706 RepID=A0A8J5N0D2_HOMAM|nr:uncharacterized protein LOC121864972 [Homarus americanus]KAG7170046.1 hypothetical protein Hamer_G012270 [Homarus americanus]